MRRHVGRESAGARCSGDSPPRARHRSDVTSAGRQARHELGHEGQSRPRQRRGHGKETATASAAWSAPGPAAMANSRKRKPEEKEEEQGGERRGYPLSPSPTSSDLGSGMGRQCPSLSLSFPMSDRMAATLWAALGQLPGVGVRESPDRVGRCLPTCRVNWGRSRCGSCTPGKAWSGGPRA